MTSFFAAALAILICPQDPPAGETFTFVGGSVGAVKSEIALELVPQSKTGVTEFAEHNIVVIRENNQAVAVDIRSTGILAMRKISQAVGKLMDGKAGSKADLTRGFGLVVDPTELPFLTQYVMDPIAMNEIAAISGIYLGPSMEFTLSTTDGKTGVRRSSEEKPTTVVEYPFDRAKMVAPSPGFRWVSLPHSLTVTVFGRLRNAGDVNSRQADGHRVFWSFFENEKTAYNGVMRKFTEQLISDAYPTLDLDQLRPGSPWVSSSTPTAMREILMGFSQPSLGDINEFSPDVRVKKLSMRVNAYMRIRFKKDEVPQWVGVEIPWNLP
jgi:hypothetical protein